MRISSGAVIVGLALAVVVPSKVQASGLGHDSAVGAMPAADGTPAVSAADVVDAPVPPAAGEPDPEVSQAAGSSPGTPAADGTSSDNSTSERSQGYPGHQLTVPALVRMGYVRREDLLVDFVEGGGCCPGPGTELMIMKGGYTSVTFGRVDSRETWSFTLSRSRLDQLTLALQRASFRSLQSRYGGACRDCAASSVTYAGRTVHCTHVLISGSVHRAVIPRRLAAVLTVLSHLARTPQAP